jgi:hypothetical protein
VLEELSDIKLKIEYIKHWIPGSSKVHFIFKIRTNESALKVIKNIYMFLNAVLF